MNDLRTTLSPSSDDGKARQSLCMAQSPTTGQMPVGAVDGNSGGTDCGNEAGK